MTGGYVVRRNHIQGGPKKEDGNLQMVTLSIKTVERFSKNFHCHSLGLEPPSEMSDYTGLYTANYGQHGGVVAK